LGRAQRGARVLTGILTGLEFDPAEAFDDPFQA